ncbi:endonuclease VII domain-containing protein [Streptomyces sp. ML-6]|uniref:endonuclease VII domain-containing protein n=1 Tax=Streptomyces sp. ML-6 TaxID=2982693 RepID=UPI0024C0AF64|nr:endonuclease VII domain-containing protein [Streptomyces sp. ML-6]MDK0525025.1 endonuclease VII domain-containing protein [Streptomyces sp. ML-6]
MQEALTPELDRQCGNPECSKTMTDGSRALYCSVPCRTRAGRIRRREEASKLTHKVCPDCQQDNPIDQYTNPWVHYCRICTNARERARYVARGGSDYAYAQSLKYNYGLTMEEYLARVEKQGGRCAVCGEKSDRRLHVDHNHRTGAVRDLLCEWCNHAIGKARDDPARLRAMADYLERHAEAAPPDRRDGSAA